MNNDKKAIDTPAGKPNPAVNLSAQLEGQFPIIGWHAFRVADQITEENYKKFIEAGFNIAFIGSRYFRPGDNENQSKPFIKALEICKKLGLAVQVNIKYPSDKTSYLQILMEKMLAAVEDLKDIPVVLGWYLWDEPTVREFGWVWEMKRAIEDTVRSDQYIYSNLTNIGATGSWCAPTYESYVGCYRDSILPQMLSFDCYCIKQADAEGAKPKLVMGYFKNLKFISEKAAEYNLPMWTFILSTAHYKHYSGKKPEGYSVYPVPKLGHLKFQAFCGMAYGSQCLQYFGYGYTENETDKNGQYKDGQYIYHDHPIDKDGNTTEVWKHIQKTNGIVQNKLAKHFIGMTVQKIFHTGSNDDGIEHDGVDGFTSQYLPQPFMSIKNEAMGVLVSYFTNNSRDYLFVVNKDFENPQEVTVRWRSIETYDVICEYCGGNNMTTPSIKPSYLKVELEPGDACLFQVKNLMIGIPIE